MKKPLIAILIIVLSPNVFANLSFSAPGASGGVVDVIEGDTITIDILGDSSMPYCAYLYCDDAIITLPVVRPAAGGSTSITPNLIPEECGYDICVYDDPMSPPAAGIHFTFTLITNAGDAGESYTLELYDEWMPETLDTLVVNVVTLPDCMQEAAVDINDPVRYAAFVEAGSPECWCTPRQCHGDAYSALLEGSSKGGFYAVGTYDLGLLAKGWEIKESPFGTGIAGVLAPIINVPAACANFDNAMVPDPLVPLSGLNPGGKGGSSKGGYYHVGSGDLNILTRYWEVKEPTFGIGVPADCFPGNR